MCLKTDTVLLQYNFYQFQYFITTCLCTVEICQEMFQSNSFNGNDLMVLFKWGWSLLINKLSLTRSLKLLASVASISKWSKPIKQLHSTRWSDTVDCLTLLIVKTFFFLLQYTQMVCSSNKKVAVCFTLISNLAVTARVTVNNVRADFFLKGTFITEQWIQFVWWLDWQNFKLSYFL